MVSISPTSTYCSDLEYLIALQSEEEAGSQLRRSQRLREKKSANDALESAAVAATENRAGSPQLFAEIYEECSQLAQTLPTHLATPNASNGTLEKTLKTKLTNSELKKRCIRSAPRKRGRQKKLTDKTAPVGSFQQSSKASAMPRKSKPKSRTRRVRSKRNVKSTQSPQLEQKSCVKPQPVLTSKVCVKTDSAGSTMSNPVAAVIIPKESAVITNSTQSYSYQCMNLTQTLLPERYPAHFIHQLPSEPKYATGTILSGELQRVSSAVIINESNKISDTIPTDSEKLSPSPPNVESWGSRTPSLSESLTEVFGTKRIRDALNIALPRQYRVQESQLPDIASMLGVKVERLRDVLELTERLTLAELQQSQFESPDLSSDEKVELVEKLTTKSCKIVG